MTSSQRAAEVQAEVFPRNKRLKFEVLVSGVQAGLLPPPLPFTNGVASTERILPRINIHSSSQVPVVHFYESRILHLVFNATKPKHD